MKKIFSSKAGKSVLASAALILLASAFVSCGTFLSSDKVSEEKLEAYFEKRFGPYLPNGFTVKVTELDSSKVKGFKRGEFEIGFPSGATQDVKFLASMDGQFLVIGDAPVTQVDDMEKKGSQGIRAGAIQTLTGEVPVILTGDRKTIIYGALEDMSRDASTETAAKINLENTPMKGSADAPVTVVEYSDFQCGFCARAAADVAKFVEEYDGKVRFFYKHFPLPFHKWAQDAGVASVCVHEQSPEKFWDIHDAIFEKQGDIKLETAKETFAGMARGLGVDMEKYEECASSQKAKKKVVADMDEGQDIGITGTPTFVVDGYLIQGGADIRSVKNAVDYRLSLKSGGSEETGTAEKAEEPAASESAAGEDAAESASEPGGTEGSEEGSAENPETSGEAESPAEAEGSGE